MSYVELMYSICHPRARLRFLCECPLSTVYMFVLSFDMVDCTEPEGYYVKCSIMVATKLINIS